MVLCRPTDVLSRIYSLTHFVYLPIFFSTSSSHFSSLFSPFHLYACPVYLPPLCSSVKRPIPSPLFHSPSLWRSFFSFLHTHCATRTQGRIVSDLYSLESPWNLYNKAEQSLQNRSNIEVTGCKVDGGPWFLTDYRQYRMETIQAAVAAEN